MNIRRPIAKLAAICTLILMSACLDEKSDDPVADNGGTPTPPSNNAPTISGNPASAVLIGDTYSFIPDASDPDGDSLTFSIQNMPTWASFNASTGEVSGQPTLSDLGSYSNIQLSVSDGQASSSMTDFTIDVTQTATSSATLSWTAPTQNEDGSSLTNLSGYKIYYGRQSGDYSNQIQIDNPSVTTYVVDNLSPNTYYFSATAVSDSGAESRFSGEAVKIVN